MNKMREVRIEKITLNIGAGKDQKLLEKALKVLESITGVPPVKTITQKRIAGWGLRPGLPIGCKSTIRKHEAIEVLSRVLEAKDNVLKTTQFDDNGNLAFGISEYIDIKDTKYDPAIGIMGLEVCVTLERPGYRVKRRKVRSAKIPMRHRITKNDAMDFMKNKFKIEVSE